MATTIAVHGNAVSFAESPGQCEQVDGIAWSNIVGLRRGWGTTFRGRAGQVVWFHYALPALSLVNGTAHNLTSLQVLFDVQGQVTVESIHIWNNNRQRIFAQDNLQRNADTTISTGNLRLNSDTGVSVGVSFQQAANITFRGLIAQLIPTVPAPPPLDVAFTGSATLRTTNDNALGPFTQPFNVNFTFSADRRSITRLNLTPIMTLPFPVDHHLKGRINVITTVSLQSTQLGSFDPNSGQLNLQITLLFSHRNADTGRDVSGAGHSTASFGLTTGTSDPAVMWRPNINTPRMSVLLTGQPRQPDGRIKVVDNATFREGFLGGSEALLEIEGRLDPTP